MLVKCAEQRTVRQDFRVIRPSATTTAARLCFFSTSTSALAQLMRHVFKS